MASDDIYLVPSQKVAGWSGDHLGKMAAYFRHIFGGSYEVYEWSSRDISGVSGSTSCDLLDWWRDDSFTDTDKNLLIASVAEWDESGCGVHPGHAAVICIKKGFENMPGPSADPDLIGDFAVSGYAAPMQAAVALQEIGHNYHADHDQGVADSHDSLNFTSPMLASYADDQAGTDNQCGRKIEHNTLNENRYVEGFSKCAVDASDFPHDLAEVYTKSDVEGL